MRTDQTTPDENDDRAGRARPPTKQLHSTVYLVLMGLSAWLIVSVWLFAGGGVTNYLLFIISGFIFAVVALQWILSRVARRDGPEAAEPSFRDWAARDFDTWQGRLSGREAMTQIVLPIAAVAIGMTVFGVVLLYAEHESPQPTASYSSGSVVKNNG